MEGGSKVRCREPSWHQYPGPISRYSGNTLAFTPPVWNDACAKCVTPYQDPSEPAAPWQVCGGLLGIWNPGICGCEPICPPGSEDCNGECIVVTEPSCFDERNCVWNTVSCEYECDDPPECDEGFIWSWTECECVPLEEDEDAYDLDAAMDSSQTRMLLFRGSGDPEDTGLYIETLLLSQAPPVSWVSYRTDQIVEDGGSPCIFPSRNGQLALAYVDHEFAQARSSEWEFDIGEHQVQVISNDNPIQITGCDDCWGRRIWAIFKDDWYIVVGALSADGQTYTLSAETLMLDGSSQPMNGANAQARLIQPPGSANYHFFFINADGAAQQRMCRNLLNDGTGVWA